MSGATDTAGEDIHQSADKVRQEDKVQTEQTVFHNNQFVCIEVKQRFCKEQTECAHTGTDDGNQNTALYQYFKAAFEFACAGVLADEADCGLVEGIHCRIDEAFEIARGSVACHGIRTEGVDGGLDEYVRNGEHRAL